MLDGACYVLQMVRGSPNPRHLGLPMRLRKARKQAGLTRMAVTLQAGAGKATSHDIEMGQRLPTVGTIARLAAAMGFRAGWLAYGLGEPISAETPANCDGMGVRLLSARVARGMTKAELGRLAGLTAPSITQIEQGGQSGVHVIEALAQALGISPAWLAFNEGSQVLPSRRRGRPPVQSSAPVD